VHSLRSRILATTLVITALAVVAFGVPLAVALVRIEHDRVVLRLEREASRVLATIPDERLARQDPSLPTPLAPPDPSARSMLIGVYDAAGVRTSGAGPAHSALAAAATTSGREMVGDEAGQLAVAVSLRGDQPSGAAVRVAVQAGDVAEDERLSSLAMLALGVVIMSLAGAAAFLLSRRLTRPLERLAGNAAQLGDGDFTVRTSASGLAEIDAVGASLDATAARLGALLQRERAFSSNASHQIRSPLTALRLNLETGPLVRDPPALGEVLAQLDRLEATLDDMLALTRDIDPPQAPFRIEPLLAQLRQRWEPALDRLGRRLSLSVEPGLPAVRGSAAGLAHVLDVLVDNALQHGTGTVTLSARSSGGTVNLQVADEGLGIAGDPEAPFQRRSRTARGHGIGLSLARSLVEADGGRLELQRAAPRPVFSVVLPAAAPLDLRDAAEASGPALR
jgi:signal transduction histidine kinase